MTAEIDATAAQFGRARNAVKERLSTRDEREKIENRLFYARATTRLAEIAQQPPVAAAFTSEDADPTETPLAAEQPTESIEPIEAHSLVDVPDGGMIADTTTDSA